MPKVGNPRFLTILNQSVFVPILLYYRTHSHRCSPLLTKHALKLHLALRIRKLQLFNTLTMLSDLFGQYEVEKYFLSVCTI